MPRPRFVALLGAVVLASGCGPAGAAGSGRAVDPSHVARTALAERADAVLAGDELADRLGGLPLAGWAYDVVSASVDGAQVVATADLTVRLADTVAALEGRRRVVLARSADGWAVVADDPVGAALPWDLGALRAAHGRHSLVLAVADPDEPTEAVAGADAEALAEVEDAAVEAVTRVWGSDWARSALVVAVPGGAGLAAVLGRSADQVAGLAAVTTPEGFVVADGAALAAVPAAGRAVLLTHETVHLATGAASHDRVPMWLEEGFADEVALAASAVPVRTAAAPLLEQVAASGLPAALPTDLPTDAAFTAARADVGATYAAAWLGARAIARRHGEAGLVAVYRATAAGRGTPPENLEAALRETLGSTTAAITADWRRDVAELAR